jgi:DNA-binding NarL/FixJ family response regulator
MRAGVRGYLLKGAEQDEIARAVMAIAAGDAIFAPGVASRVLARLNVSGATIRPQAFPTLTAREYDVLVLLVAGHPTGVTAARLDLTSKTVSNNVSNILVKLHVPDPTQAAILAREAGLPTSTDGKTSD